VETVLGGVINFFFFFFGFYLFAESVCGPLCGLCMTSQRPRLRRGDGPQGDGSSLSNMVHVVVVVVTRMEMGRRDPRVGYSSSPGGGEGGVTAGYSIL
jgi:hypothetical protein